MTVWMILYDSELLLYELDLEWGFLVPRKPTPPRWSQFRIPAGIAQQGKDRKSEEVGAKN